MRRLREWLRSIGRNTRMDLPLHRMDAPVVVPIDERSEVEHRRKLQHVDRKLSQLERELAIIVANIQHTDGNADDVARNL